MAATEPLPRLNGTPLGTGDAVICDTCDATITRGRSDLRPDRGEGNRDRGYLLAAKEMGRWVLRWITCQDCGPFADSADVDDGQVIARCGFGYAKHSHRRGTHVVANAHVPADVEQAGDLSALRYGGP